MYTCVSEKLSWVKNSELVNINSDLLGRRYLLKKFIVQNLG